MENRLVIIAQTIPRPRQLKRIWRRVCGAFQCGEGGLVGQTCPLEKKRTAVGGRQNPLAGGFPLTNGASRAGQQRGDKPARGRATLAGQQPQTGGSVGGQQHFDRHQAALSQPSVILQPGGLTTFAQRHW